MTIVIGALLTALSGNALIYLGLAFVNARLLPETLQPIYAATGHWSRTLIMTAVVALPSNWLFAAVFRAAPSPGHAAMAILSTLAVVLAANTFLLGGTLGWRSAAATLAMIGAAAWFAAEQSPV